MIITNKDRANRFVNVEGISQIKKSSVRRKFSSCAANLVFIPFIYIFVVNIVGMRFDNTISIIFSCILALIICAEIYNLVRANMLQTEYKYMKSRACINVSFLIAVLIQAAFTVTATIFRKVDLTGGNFIIDGTYLIIAMPIGVVVWVFYLAGTVTTYLGTLNNLSKQSYDDEFEPLYCDKFMDRKAIYDIHNPKIQTSFTTLFYFYTILLFVGSLMIYTVDFNDVRHFAWGSLIIVGVALLVGISFIANSVKYKVFRKWYFILLSMLPFILLTLMRYGECLWGQVLFYENGEPVAELNTLLFMFVYVPGEIFFSVWAYKWFLKAFQGFGFTGTQKDMEEYLRKEEEATKKAKLPPEDF